MDKIIPNIQIQPIYEMKKFLSSAILFLAVMKKGTAMQQLNIIFTLSFFGGLSMGIGNFFKNYIFPDPTFGKTFIILLILDTLFGIINHLKSKDFDFKELAKDTLIKIIVGLGVMAFTKTLLVIPEVMSSEWATSSLTYFLKTGLVTWLGLSFLGSVYIITKGKFPPKFMMERLTKFNETGDTEILLDRETETTEELIEEVIEQQPDNINEAL